MVLQPREACLEGSEAGLRVATTTRMTAGKARRLMPEASAGRSSLHGHEAVAYAASGLAIQAPDQPRAGGRGTNIVDSILRQAAE